MSWDSWTERILVQDNGVKAADMGSIVGQDGRAWGCSGGQLVMDEKTMSDIRSLYDKGVGDVQSLTIDGKKHMVIGTDDKEIVCKCGPGGATVSKAKTCFVIGLYKAQDVAPGNNKTRVSKIREDLEALGF